MQKSQTAEKHLQLWSEGETVLGDLSSGAAAAAAGDGGRVLRGAHARAWAAGCRRDSQAAEQQVHGGEQRLGEADGAEGRTPVGGEVYLVGVWAGGDEGWLELVQCAVEGEETERSG